LPADLAPKYRSILMEIAAVRSPCAGAAPDSAGFRVLFHKAFASASAQSGQQEGCPQ
jgi:hypothetical protein